MSKVFYTFYLFFLISILYYLVCDCKSKINQPVIPPVIPVKHLSYEIRIFPDSTKKGYSYGDTVKVFCNGCNKLILKDKSGKVADTSLNDTLIYPASIFYSETEDGCYILNDAYSQFSIFCDSCSESLRLYAKTVATRDETRKVEILNRKSDSKTVTFFIKKISNSPNIYDWKWKIFSGKKITTGEKLKTKEVPIKLETGDTLIIKCEATYQRCINHITVNYRLGGKDTIPKYTNDQDGDGVNDKDDRCPDKPGTPALNGCPDRDGDNIPDIDDLCPNDPGPAELKGCPQVVKTDSIVILLRKYIGEYETHCAAIINTYNSTSKSSSDILVLNLNNALASFWAELINLQNHSNRIICIESKCITKGAPAPKDLFYGWYGINQKENFKKVYYTISGKLSKLDLDIDTSDPNKYKIIKKGGGSTK